MDAPRPSPRRYVLPVAFFNIVSISLFTFSHDTINETAARLHLVNPLYRWTPLQEEVRNVTRITYNAYLNACEGRDEFDSYTNECHDWFNVSLTMLDSLDTLVLMRLDDEYTRTRAYLAKTLSFRIVDRVSMFELVIRALGGLNAAFALTSDPLWREKAIELADVLLPTFNITQSGCPPMNTRVGAELTSQNEHDEPFDTSSTPADAGTLQLEMRTVSAMCGDKRYAVAADRCMLSMVNATPHDRLAPQRFDVQQVRFSGSRESIGASVDSYYEMMLKTWVAFGKQREDSALRATFERAMDLVYTRITGTSVGGATYVGHRYTKGTLQPEMEHLSCFLPGTLALGALHGLGGGRDGMAPDDYMPRARGLARTCASMADATVTGLAPEITSFNAMQPQAAPGFDRSLLRPEIVESLFYLCKIDDARDAPPYAQWGERMWRSMVHTAQAPGRPAGVLSGQGNLNMADGTERSAGGKLHSFVIAETLKYFFLLFDERPLEQMPARLDQWVFNTEAHPVRMRRQAA